MFQNILTPGCSSVPVQGDHVHIDDNADNSDDNPGKPLFLNILTSGCYRAQIIYGTAVHLASEP